MRTLSKKSKNLLYLTTLFYSIDALLVIALLYSNAAIVAVSGDKDLNKIVIRVLISLGIFLLSYLCSIVAGKLRYSFLSNAEVELKSNIIQNIMSRSYWNFKEKSSAFYVNLLLTDTDTYRENYLDSIPLMANSIVSIISAAYMLFTFHPLLLLLGVLMAFISMFIMKPFSKAISTRTEEFSSESEEYNKSLKEMIDGYETIKLNRAEGEFNKKYDNISNRKQNAWKSLSFLRFISFESLMSVAGLSAIVALGAGAYLVYKGYFEAAWILAIINYFTSLSNQLSNFSSLLVTYKSAKTIENKLFKEISLLPVAKSGKILDFDKGIKIDELSFSYGDKQIFNKSSFNFESGKCYAVVGESGSGKTTLIKLLLKYYQNYDGKISFAGENLMDLTNEDIYGSLYLVNQNPFMFDATLDDNIMLFKNHKMNYNNIIKLANLEKLRDSIGENSIGSFGDKISGGEKQRINIARALCQDSKIIIFDEPTTGLDPQNKSMIDNLIFNLEGITRIVITHDWNEAYLSKFDKIYKIGI